VSNRSLPNDPRPATWRARWRELKWRLREIYLADCTFIHINKTGGSSVEKALDLPFTHRTAAEIIALVGPRRWSNRFTFTVVRNPWDKVVSHYTYRRIRDRTGIQTDNVSFAEWVRLAYGENDPRYYNAPKMFMPQSQWITDAAGEVLVDFVARFESLEADFQRICARLGVSARLPHLKKTDRSHYRQLHTPDTRALVGRWFREDILHLLIGQRHLTTQDVVITPFLATCQLVWQEPMFAGLRPIPLN